jgi:energy-coupling factor transport system ATP-binding protein
MEGGIVKVVLDDVIVKRQNFSLAAQGEFPEGIHLISGAVGSGKSTLALAIAGNFPTEHGRISRVGFSSMMISMQFPEYHVTGMTLKEECISWGYAPEEFFSSPDLLGREDQSPFAISRGELKRFHLSCVLKKHYDLLLLDEPFSSLDCESKLEFCHHLLHRKEGVTIIFTHEEMFLPHVDRIWEITSGVLSDRGTLPGALPRWTGAPPHIKKMIEKGKTPKNISYEDVLEAACRT